MFIKVSVESLSNIKVTEHIADARLLAVLLKVLVMALFVLHKEIEPQGLEVPMILQISS